MPTSGLHVLDVFSENVEVGTYVFVFEVFMFALFSDSYVFLKYLNCALTACP